MGFLSAISNLLNSGGAQQGQPNIQANDTHPVNFLQNIAKYANAFLSAQPQIQENNIKQQQLLAMQLANQNTPIANALQNKLLEQQGIGYGIENQYRGREHEADLDLKNAQASLAKRGAASPFSDIGKEIKDLQALVNSKSPLAPFAAILLQNKLKQGAGSVGYTENGQPVLLGGAGYAPSNVPVNPFAAAGSGGSPAAGNPIQSILSSALGVPAQQQSAGQGQQQPNAQGQAQPANPLQSGYFLKNQMTGTTRGGAGGSYYNPVTGETLTSPTTAQTSAIQNQMRSIENIVPMMDTLAKLGTGALYGAPYFGNKAADYDSHLANMVDKYVVASKFPPTNEGIAKAENILKRRETESDAHYIERINKEKKILINTYKNLQKRLSKGFSNKEEIGSGAGSLNNLTDEQILKMLGPG